MNAVRRRYVRATDGPFNLDGAMVSLWNCCGLTNNFHDELVSFFALSRDIAPPDLILPPNTKSKEYLRFEYEKLPL